MTTSNTNARVGVNQLLAIVPRLGEKESVKTQLATIENKGSSKAAMYSIDDIRTLFRLSNDEYNLLHTEATKPRTSRSSSDEQLDSLVVELADKISKIKSLDDQIKNLTTERDALQIDVKQIRSKFKVK
jgi:chromosome segregation ATPase